MKVMGVGGDRGLGVCEQRIWEGFDGNLRDVLGVNLNGEGDDDDDNEDEEDDDRV